MKNKASRKQMQNRIGKGKSKQTAGYCLILNKKTNDPVWAPNRAKRQSDVAWKRGASGRTAKEEAKEKRKEKLVAARKVLKQIRKETQQAMRRNEG